MAALLGSRVDVESNGAEKVQTKDHVVVECQVTNKTAERVIHALGATDIGKHNLREDDFFSDGGGTAKSANALKGRERTDMGR